MKGSASESALWHCPVCPKSFSRKGDLTRHNLLHAGIKRYVCTICNKAFSQYSGLKTHRNVHTKVKPFVCGFNSCSASFGDPSSCARHRKETHRRMGAYRCPHPLCKSSIKRRSAFAAHLRKHNIDITYVDIDAMALPLPPVAVIDSVPKREPVQEAMVIDVMPQRSFEAQQARHMPVYSDANDSESTLHHWQFQVPHHQNLIPWTHYGDSDDIMAGPSVLSTLPNFSVSDSFSYDHINHVGALLAMDSSSRLDLPALNLPSLIRPQPSFETTALPGEPVIKTKAEVMANVPRTFNGVRFSSMFKESAFDSSCPYPDLKPLAYDLPTLPWVQPT